LTFTGVEYNMEIEVFKDLIVHYAFFKSGSFEQTWIDQVKCINEYWDDLIKDIDIEEFLKDYLRVCSKKNLTRRPIDILLNMHNTLSIWRIELMTRVANMITQFFVDETKGKFVKWNGSEMEFLHKLTCI
jgi:hypothetical protein